MSALADRIRAELRTRADPARAEGNAAYMKVAERGALPYLGVRRPDVRAIVRAAARDTTDSTALVSAVRDLWESAAYAEERYAAQDLLGLPWARGRLDLLDLHRQMALTGAWWDVVDEVATHLVREVLEGAPDVEGLRLREWAVDEHLWLRRTAIIGQVGRKERLDQNLLTDAIEPNLADRDSFIRKAIGWALRDHARVAPDWVLAFVDGHAAELSGLSRREATRHLTPGATPGASPTPQVG
jgi:3-methyladenine DNA glycosylase AlkD